MKFVICVKKFKINNLDRFYYLTKLIRIINYLNDIVLIIVFINIWFNFNRLVWIFRIISRFRLNMFRFLFSRRSPIMKIF